MELSGTIRALIVIGLLCTLLGRFLIAPPLGLWISLIGGVVGLGAFIVGVVQNVARRRR